MIAQCKKVLQIGISEMLKVAGNRKTIHHAPKWHKGNLGACLGASTEPADGLMAAASGTSVALACADQRSDETVFQELVRE